MITRIAMLVLVMCAVCACSSKTQPTRFYVLAPVTVTAPSRDSGQDIVLGLGPIELPQYLDRPQIVTRRGEHELDIAEFERWGEPLEDGFANALAQNLMASAAIRQVLVYPWRRSTKFDYQLALQVERFEADANAAYLDTRWTLSDGDGTVLDRREVALTEMLTGKDYTAIVAALSRLSARLCEQIIASLPPVRH